MALKVAFGNGSKPTQWILPGTDPSQLPHPLPDQPVGNALASGIIEPAFPDLLFGGKVAVGYDDYGATVFDVTGGWNSVKNAWAWSDEAETLVFDGFVQVDVTVGQASDWDSDITLIGVKRANVVTGEGNDIVAVELLSNDASQVRDIRIATNGGDDDILVTGLDREGKLADGDTTYASFVGAAGTWDTTGKTQTVYADLGDGDDVFDASTTAAKLIVDGGEGWDDIYGGSGRDSLSGGAGDDFIQGGDGFDTLVGGLGTDYLVGGNGADRFVATASDGGLFGWYQWRAADGGNDHWYRVVEEYEDWEGAEALAEFYGVTLATLTSAAENAFVTGLLAGKGLDGWWIGGLQAETEGGPDAGWGWVTGEPWAFTNWNAGEPNDNGGFDERSLILYGDGTWNDEDPQLFTGWVLESETLPVSALGGDEADADIIIDFNHFENDRIDVRAVPGLTFGKLTILDEGPAALVWAPGLEPILVLKQHSAPLVAADFIFA